MHFIVHALDKPDASERRLANIDAHRAYLFEAEEKHPVRFLLSGPLIDDSAEEMIGSFFLIEAADRSAIHRVLADDPLALANVWEECQIHSFFPRVNKFKYK